jgi:hypothetical protein
MFIARVHVCVCVDYLLAYVRYICVWFVCLALLVALQFNIISDCTEMHKTYIAGATLAHPVWTDSDHGDQHV